MLRDTSQTREWMGGQCCNREERRGQPLEVKRPLGACRGWQEAANTERLELQEGRGNCSRWGKQHKQNNGADNEFGEAGLHEELTEGKSDC